MANTIFSFILHMPVRLTPLKVTEVTKLHMLLRVYNTYWCVHISLATCVLWLQCGLQLCGKQPTEVCYPTWQFTSAAVAKETMR